MEYELEDEPRSSGTDDRAKDRPHASDVDENDSELIRDHSALRHQSSVHPEDYPLEDRAVNIPEEEKK
jgi:hypothetical protein